MKIRVFILLSICLIFLSPSLLASEIRVTSRFDKRAVDVNQEINLKIKVEGATGNIQAPRLPAYDGFETFYTGRASHMTFVNGKSSSSVEFSYVLVPKKVGQFVLDPIEMTVSGRRFRTDPVKIEVSQSSVSSQPYAGSPVQQTNRTSPSGYTPPSSQPTPYQAPPANFKPTDDNVFVRAWVDKTTVYPNEQILLTYSLYTRYDTRYEGFQEEPQVSGFWIEEFPAEREIRRETVRLGGKRYIKADIKKMALFPTAAADYTIQPGTIKVSVRQEQQSSSVFDEFFNDSFFSGGSFFARRENRLLKPAPIAITVKNFPDAGKPESFQGATGNFRMQSQIDKREGKQNEPITVTITIEGEGNIETLEMPVIPDLKNFKVYESDTSSQLYKTGNVIGGRKTFEVVFIPTEAGNIELPSLPFTFFNPSTGQYQTLSTPRFPLTIEKSDEKLELTDIAVQSDVFKKKVEVEGRDIRYIWEYSPDLAFQRNIHKVYLGFAGADAFLVTVLLLGLLRLRRDQIFAKDVGLKRKKFAKSQANTRLKPLNQLLKSDSTEDNRKFFEETEKTLTQYLSDKFNLSAYGTTRSDLEQKLEQTLGPDDKLYQEIMELYKYCDESRFGMAQASAAHKQNAYKILKDAISRVEKLK